MLTDVKVWLENTGMKVAEKRFLVPPALPYIIFIESTDIGGADSKNNIARRQISVELYSDRIDPLSEQKIAGLLNDKSIPYTKDRTWIESEKFFQTVYDFNLIEKI